MTRPLSRIQARRSIHITPTDQGESTNAASAVTRLGELAARQVGSRDRRFPCSCDSLDEVGVQLCPCGIATCTP